MLNITLKELVDAIYSDVAEFSKLSNATENAEEDRYNELGKIYDPENFNKVHGKSDIMSVMGFNETKGVYAVEYQNVLKSKIIASVMKVDDSNIGFFTAPVHFMNLRIVNIEEDYLLNAMKSNFLHIILMYEFTNNITMLKTEFSSDDTIFNVLNNETFADFLIDTKEGMRRSQDDIIHFENLILNMIIKFRKDVVQYYDDSSITDLNLNNLNNGIYSPEYPVYWHGDSSIDTLAVFKNSEKIKPVGNVAETFEDDMNKSVEELRKKFNLFKDRDFTDEEKEMMENNKTPDYYKPSENLIKTLRKIKTSMYRPENLQIKNILFEGPSGTGKTQDSKVLADMIGLPYTKITCGADMDSTSVLGAIYPIVNEQDDIEKQKQLNRYNAYTDSDFEYLADEIYTSLNGPKKDNITSQDARTLVDKRKRELYNEIGMDTNSEPKYVYYASEIVKAFENGWLLEIQEPTCIADAGVLSILNSALELNGVINLPTRTVTRHPNFFCVITTNRNYEGCRPLNQAFRNRFQLTRKVDLPDADKLRNILLNITHCKDTGFVDKFAAGMLSLTNYLKSENLPTVISLRNAKMFIADVMDGIPVPEALDENIVWNLSTDEEDIVIIRKGIASCELNLLTTYVYPEITNWAKDQ